MTTFSDRNIGRYFNGTDAQLYASATADHQIVGDVSVALVFKQTRAPAESFDFLVGCGDSGETEAANFTFGVYINQTGNHLTYFHEHGAGVNELLNTTHDIEQDVNNTLVVIRNVAANTYRAVLNGADLGTTSYINDPTGGTSAYLQVGRAINVQEFQGNIAFVGLWNKALTVEQAQKYDSIVRSEYIDIPDRVIDIDDSIVSFYEMKDSGTEEDLVSTHDLTNSNVDPAYARYSPPTSDTFTGGAVFRNRFMES